MSSAPDSLKKPSFIGSVTNSYAVFLIGPIIAGIAAAPIAKAAGYGLNTRNLILQLGILVGALAALGYFAASSRQFLKEGGGRRTSCFLILAAYAGILIAVSSQLLGIVE
jgi:hypothetical protein